MQRRLKFFAVASTIGMLLLLLGGALVTKTESGDGCGSSWPLCHGEFIPTQISSELVIELSHRMVTGVVALTVLGFVYLSWKHVGHIRETKFLSILAISFLLLQSLIGAATVLWGQSDFFMAMHFGISLISFASVFLLTLLIFEVDKKFHAEHLVIGRRLQWHTIGVTIYSFIVIYTGALVRHTNSSMICADWPLCNNNAFSLPTNMYEWIQMGHRLAAGFIFLWIFYIFILTVRHYRHEPVLYYGWMVAFSLVTLQVMSGALIVFTSLNLFISLLHALFISSLFGMLSYFIFLISRSQHRIRITKANIDVPKSS